jgi:hypothetical protein
VPLHSADLLRIVRGECELLPVIHGGAPAPGIATLHMMPRTPVDRRRELKELRRST